jgi:hypothetical protein
MFTQPRLLEHATKHNLTYKSLQLAQISLCCPNIAEAVDGKKVKGHSTAGRLRSTEKFNDLIGN